MDITTVLSEKCMNMVGVTGGKDWGDQRSWHEADGRDNIGYVLE